MKDLIDLIIYMLRFVAYFTIGAAAVLTASVAFAWMFVGMCHVMP